MVKTTMYEEEKAIKYVARCALSVTHNFAIFLHAKIHLIGLVIDNLFNKFANFECVFGKTLGLPAALFLIFQQLFCLCCSL